MCLCVCVCACVRVRVCACVRVCVCMHAYLRVSNDIASLMESPGNFLLHAPPTHSLTTPPLCGLALPSPHFRLMKMTLNRRHTTEKTIPTLARTESRRQVNTVIVRIASLSWSTSEQTVRKIKYPGVMVIRVLWG